MKPRLTPADLKAIAATLQEEIAHTKQERESFAGELSDYQEEIFRLRRELDEAEAELRTRLDYSPFVQTAQRFSEHTLSHGLPVRVQEGCPTCAAFLSDLAWEAKSVVV